MPEVSEEAQEYARQQFKSGIEDLLDDPSNLLHPGRDEEPRDYFERNRRIAQSLGLDFDALVDSAASDYERQRLRDIESGKLAPSGPLNPNYWS